MNYAILNIYIYIYIYICIRGLFWDAPCANGAFPCRMTRIRLNAWDNWRAGLPMVGPVSCCHFDNTTLLLYVG